jgi:anti-anti-sigma factor
MSLTLQSHFCGNVHVIHCAGCITSGHEALTLEEALNEAEHEFSRFVLDLSKVTRIDSMGIGLLVRHAHRLTSRGGTIRLAAPQPFVAHLLHITRLSNFLKSYPTEEEAIQSFQEHHPPQQAPPPNRRRLLVFDQSSDLCIFVRTVLAQQGFDVRTASSIRDAKVLLRVDDVDFILVGPCIPQLTAEFVEKELSAISPNARALHLGTDFHNHDAHAAAEILLQMFGVGDASQIGSA